MIISQPAGEGDGEETLAGGRLLGAWLGVPVTVAGGTITAIDASSGTTIVIDGDEITATGLPGALLFSVGEERGFISWTKDVSGVELVVDVPPLVGERVGDRDERSYALALERIIRDLQGRVLATEPETRVWNPVLNMAGRTYQMTYSGSGVVTLSYSALTGYRTGCRAYVIIPAGTATDLIVPNRLTLGEPFDAAKDYTIVVEAVSNRQLSWAHNYAFPAMTFE